MPSPFSTPLKVELRYRRAGVKADHCRKCNSYIERVRIGGHGRHEAGFYPRCRIIGLAPSARHNVHPDHVCDRFDGSIARLLDMGDMWYRENYGEDKLREALKAGREREEILEQLRKEGRI